MHPEKGNLSCSDDELKTVIVTGGSRGLGLGVVRQAAMKGYSVAVIARSSNSGFESFMEKANTAGLRVSLYCADIRDEAATASAINTIGTNGIVVGLVNCAGIVSENRSILQLRVGELDDVFAVNVRGTVVATREAAKLMSIRHGNYGGTIINVSSMAARHGGRGDLAIYAASKGAVDAFTVSAAKELAKDGISVFGIRPGVTRTEMTAHLTEDPEALASIEATIASGRIAEVDEVAVPIVRLLSKEFEYLSGSIVDASGGGLVVAK